MHINNRDTYKMEGVIVKEKNNSTKWMEMDSD
jgi:hypothetical protein